MVERTGRLRRVEGEILDTFQEMDNMPLLVELFDAGGTVLHAMECEGRFRLEKVLLGTYRAVITRADGPIIELDPLEIV